MKKWNSRNIMQVRPNNKENKNFLELHSAPVPIWSHPLLLNNWGKNPAFPHIIFSLQLRTVEYAPVLCPPTVYLHVFVNLHHLNQNEQRDPLHLFQSHTSPTLALISFCWIFQPLPLIKSHPPIAARVMVKI